MNEFIHSIEIGKNKYNLLPIAFTDKAGKTTLYRFYHPGMQAQLEKAIALIDKYNAHGLTENEYVSLVSMLWIVHHKSTDKSNSKLDGISSLSTSCLDNPGCMMRMQDCNTICHACYSATQQKRQHGLEEHNVINGLILRNVAIPAAIFAKVLPIENERFFRIESFGDVSNATQVENYLSLCKAFPNTCFAAWTKVALLWIHCFRKHGKPENMSFIVSSLYTNIVLDMEENKKWIDHVFTVYDVETIKAKGIRINCGGRRCMECIKAGKRCYYRGTDFHIAEQKK